jgi:hypothetical protein
LYRYISRIGPRWEFSGNIDSKPERPDISSFDGKDVLESSSLNVRPTCIETVQGGCWDIISGSRGLQIGKTDFDVLDGLPGREDANLKSEIFPPVGFSLKGSTRTRLDPAERKVAPHTDRKLPLLGEKKERGAWMVCDKPIRLRGCGDDLHWIEAVELVDGLELEDFGSGQIPPDPTRPPLGREAVAVKPGLKSEFFSAGEERVRLGVNVIGIGAPAYGPLIGHIVDIILPGNGSRLDDQIAEFPGDLCGINEFDLLVRMGIHDDDILFFRDQIPSPPWKMDPDRVCVHVHSKHGPVITESGFIPGTDAVGDLFPDR